MTPMRPLPENWTPSRDKAHALKTEFGRIVDLNLLLRRFRNYYTDGQTARDWDAKFENWVLAEISRSENGTNDLGVPLRQRPARTKPLQPGEPGYVSPEELADWARRGATA